jgi:hypothetical protein
MTQKKECVKILELFMPQREQVRGDNISDHSFICTDSHLLVVILSYPSVYCQLLLLTNLQNMCLTSNPLNRWRKCIYSSLEREITIVRGDYQSCWGDTGCH